MSVFAKLNFSAVCLLLGISLSGCGSFPAGGNGLSISASALSVATTGQVQFKATLPDGTPAAVRWTVSAEDTSSPGAGTIDATGLYTPPNALSADSLPVQVTARLAGDPSRTAMKSIEVTPGFLQSLLPENAALSPGAMVEVSAQIAEINAGSIHWSLSDSALGTLGASSCQRNAQQYTICKTTFTAPSIVSGLQAVRVIATVNATNTQSQLRVLLNNAGINSNAGVNQSTQSSLAALGTSGGNDSDYDVYKDASGNSYIADCCGGTLGALVEDSQHNQFILSNNHVLAESDQGKIGDTIDQPGLIDDACRPLSHAGSIVRPLGTLRYYVPLATPQSNVDAALAAVTPGAVNPDGSILQLGSVSGGMNTSLGAAPPVAGMGETLNASTLDGLHVAKSGRTTGLTCSTVESVNLAVKVDYYKDCAETQPYYTKTFTGQIGIAGNSFSDSGDSGSLVVDAANAQPVGLFYAGGTDGNGNGLSVANPIGDVLNELGTQTGSRMSVVGTSTSHGVSCVNYDSSAASAALPELSQTAQARAQKASADATASLLNREQGILGIAAGQSLDSPGDPAIIVYTDKTKKSVSVPQAENGTRTVVIPTDETSVAANSVPKQPPAVDGIRLPDSALKEAAAVEQQYRGQLLSDPAIFGVGVTQSRDNPQEAALLILVDLNKAPHTMPATLGGLRVRYLQLHRFHVTQSKYASNHPVSSCSLQGMKLEHSAQR